MTVAALPFQWWLTQRTSNAKGKQTMANLLGPLGLQNRVPAILTRRRSVEVSEAAGPTNCTAVILSHHLYLMEQMVCIFRLQDDLTPLMTAALAGRYLSTSGSYLEARGYLAACFSAVTRMTLYAYSPNQVE